MPSRRLRLLPFLLCAATALPAASINDCLDLASPPDRLECVEGRLEREPLSDEAWTGLLDHLAATPEDAALVHAALSRDEGSARVSWRAPDGTLAWERAVAPGTRLLHGALALAEAERDDLARAWSERLAALGDRDSAAQLRRRFDWPASETAPPVPLVATSWLKRLPDLPVHMYDGTQVELASTRGSVLILDFWATWCPPCLQELPHLQRLVDELSGAGLQAITINVREQRSVALGVAKQIGLELPIGGYTRELDREFRVGALPTVILVDRKGRIRQRWSGFGPGGEKPIAALARRVVAGEPASTETVAEVLHGSGRFRALWAKTGQSPIEGLAVLPSAAGRGAVAAVRRNQHLTVLDAAGGILHRVPGFPATALRSADLTGDGRPELVGVLRGGDDVTVLELESGGSVTGKVPSPALDLALSPAGDGPGEIVVAAADGVYRLTPQAGDPRKVDATGETLSVVAPADPSGAWRLLTTARELRRYGRAWQPDGATPAPEDSRRLVAGAGGWGVATADVRSIAVGRFQGGASQQVALATADGQLVVLAADDGEVVFRARWQGISRVAAGDLDGDGRDELAVADGRRMTLLTPRPDPSPAENTADKRISE
jgi:thiol-disulfide isomerase/thioredoxin